MNWKESGDIYYVRSGMGTGSIADMSSCRIIKYPLNKYEIDVVVDEDDKFMGIIEIRINKDFLSPRQRLATRSFLDVDEHYKEE